MIIKDIFSKDIDREIQGVVVAGQGEEVIIAQELEEYVVTKELQKHFADFFAAYKKGIIGTTPKMGVWISGFFGSGKSHFLKILSYLLENNIIDGKRAIDYFIDDNKIVDPMVLADIKLAIDTPTDVISFNIDAKSQSDSKQNKDAIVNVFLKVFNAMQGFSSTNPHLADLERKLREVGLFDKFKEIFEEEYGDKWEASRQDFDFIQDTVVDVLVDIDFMSEAAARNWCEKANEPYQISIEDFAKRVKSYINSKGKNHHVVFLVDEMGQYIGDNSNLMLNLQTVTEELGKECMGKAWVIVTSQQDIDSITQVKGNDFSKIQGRFDTRLSLSSANVDTVIKKRILEKNETARETLSLLYEQKATIIKNLIVFNDGVEKKLYSTSDDFVNVYPFIPYQFNLVSSVLTSVRTHSSSGKHLSDGERSMLSLFKESAMQLMNEEVGAIVPFHKFYDALENFLDHSHRGVISKAYTNSFVNPDNKDTDVFAINVLKTLFMIKYVLEIEANVDNITSLMIDNIENDRIEVEDKVEKALKVLMRQMLVQKNGNVYVFLTDEEQEINREIDSQNIEIANIINKVSEMIFDDIFTDKKYRYPEFNGRYLFPFNQIVDDRPYKSNQNCDIGLRILTPWYEGGMEDSVLRMMSGQGKEVLVVLPNDTAFLDEIRAYMKIEKFLQLNTSAQLSKYESIKESKRSEMRERNDNAKLYLTESIKESTIYVNGDIVRTGAKEVSSRINEAMGRLVQTVYHKLSYIDKPMGDSDIRKLLNSTNNISLELGDVKDINIHAIDEVRNFITTNSRILHTKTSMKSIKDRFMKAPFGFVDDDINWIVCKLFKIGDISFTINGENITLMNKKPEDIFDYITKKTFNDKLLIEERLRVSEKDKKVVRDVIKDLFGVGSVSEDEDTIMENFKKYSRSLITEITNFEFNYEKYKYPGKKILKDGKKLLNSIEDIKSPVEFFETISKDRDDFFDFAEDFEPIKTFFKGEQVNIFKKILDTLEIYNDSKTYIVNRELEEIAKEMEAIVKKENPYRDIPKLPDLRDKFNDVYLKILETESKPILDKINDSKTRVLEQLSGKAFEDNKKLTYINAFEELRIGAEECNNVSILRSYGDKADALKIRLLNEIDEFEMEKIRKEIENQSKSSKLTTGAVHYTQRDERAPYITRKTRNISIKKVTKTSTWRIESEEDIEKYINELKKELISEFRDNDVLNIEF